LSDRLRKQGYVDLQNLFGAGYDWRRNLDPRVKRKYHQDLKALVELAYSQNNDTPVVLIGHSMGCPTIQEFIVNPEVEDELDMTHEDWFAWRSKYLKSCVFISPCLTGSPMILKAFLSGVPVPMVISALCAQHRVLNMQKINNIGTLCKAQSAKYAKKINNIGKNMCVFYVSFLQNMVDTTTVRELVRYYSGVMLCLPDPLIFPYPMIFWNNEKFTVQDSDLIQVLRDSGMPEDAIHAIQLNVLSRRATMRKAPQIESHFLTGCCVNVDPKRGTVGKGMEMRYAYKNGLNSDPTTVWNESVIYSEIQQNQPEYPNNIINQIQDVPLDHMIGDFTVPFSSLNFGRVYWPKTQTQPVFHQQFEGGLEVSHTRLLDLPALFDYLMNNVLVVK
jgi:hypothetical protein